MKKISTLFFLLNTLYLFSQNEILVEKIDSINCTIVKIDSVNNYYLIYAQSEKKQYTIFSRKSCNSCSNIEVGEIYKLNLCTYYDRSALGQFMECAYNIGPGTNVKIDWGDNLYKSKELCGLCYETDTIKLKKYKKKIYFQEKFEYEISTMWLRDKTIKKFNLTFFDLLSKIEANNVNIIIENNESIPVLGRNYINNTFFCTNDTIQPQPFIGKIYYEYNNKYFIRSHYEVDNETEIIGWVDMKYFPEIKNFGKYLKKKLKQKE